VQQPSDPVPERAWEFDAPLSHHPQFRKRSVLKIAGSAGSALAVSIPRWSAPFRDELGSGYVFGGALRLLAEVGIACSDVS